MEISDALLALQFRKNYFYFLQCLRHVKKENVYLTQELYSLWNFKKSTAEPLQFRKKSLNLSNKITEGQTRQKN